MKKNIRIIIVLFFILPFVSCKKNDIQKPIPEIEKIARETLKNKLPSNDYLELNWNKSIIKKINDISTLIEVESNIDPEKHMYFSYLNNTPVYNWVKIETSTIEKGKETGCISIYGNNNVIINKFYFVDNNIIKDVTISKSTTSFTPVKKKELDDIDYENALPPVTVIGTIKSNEYNFWSLYWIFNMNNNFIPMYDCCGYNYPIVNTSYNDNSYATIYSCKATKDILNDGSIQITGTYPNAFLLSPLDLKFTYNPTNLQLNTTSISSKPTGIFAGTWVLSSVNNICNVGSSILFEYTHLNSFSFGGINLNKPYTMAINYDSNSNTLYWNWK